MSSARRMIRSTMKNCRGTEEVSGCFSQARWPGEFPAAHAQQQALVLLDGAEAAQEARHHDDAAQGDDEVGGGERREGGRQAGEAALGHGEPQAHPQQAAAAQLEATQEVRMALPVTGHGERVGERKRTQKSRLKRKSMYLMQQMQPRAMMESRGAARKKAKICVLVCHRSRSPCLQEFCHLAATIQEEAHLFRGDTGERRRWCALVLQVKAWKKRTQ